MSKETFTVYLDREGLITVRESEAVSAPLIVRYQNDEPWCIKHNCKLSQCREKHPPVK